MQYGLSRVFFWQRPPHGPANNQYARRTCPWLMSSGPDSPGSATHAQDAFSAGPFGGMVAADRRVLGGRCVRGRACEWCAGV